MVGKKTFGVNLDMNKQELQNAKIHNLTTAQIATLATSLVSNDKGLLVFDTTLLKLFVWNGSLFLNIMPAPLNLQQTTDNGNTTTQDVGVNRILIFDPESEDYHSISIQDDTLSFIDATGKSYFISAKGVVGLVKQDINGNDITGALTSFNLTANRQYFLPDRNITFAGSDDISNLQSQITFNLTNIIVKSLSDLPTPVGGIITLANNATYQFKGLVNIGTNQIQVSVSNTILGDDKSDDGIVYTGTGAAILCTNQTLSVVNILISCSLGTAFSVTNSTTFSLQIRECIFASGGFGTVTGGNIIAFTNNIFTSTMSSGMTVLGTCNKVAFSNNFHEGLTGSGTLISIPSGSFKNIEFLSSNLTVATGVIGINIGAITYTSITTEAGIILGNIFDGLGTFISGINSESNNNWLVLGNTGILPTTTRGKLFMIANATNTTITSTAAYVKMLGTTTSANLSRITMPTNNRLQFTGVQPTTLKLTAVGSITSASNNQTSRVVFFKNGVIISESEQEIRITNANESTQFSLCTYVNAVTNDFYEVFVRNVTSTGALRVEYLSFII